MEILELKKYEGPRTVYRCTCKQCAATVNIEPTEFKYEGGLRLTWLCPACDRRINEENVLLLQKQKIVIHASYKVVNK